MLISANSLVRHGTGVFVPAGREPIPETETSGTEARLTGILEAARDLSSTSTEIERQIADRFDEYRLSCKRANFLRPLALSPGARILEIGSGCGVSTRYLVEQGCAVDGIEPFAPSAKLAALRCRGFDDVTITCADLDGLVLPGECYDVVVLPEAAGPAVGSGSDLAALLSRLKAALRAGGILVVASENPTGFKYLTGARSEGGDLRPPGMPEPDRAAEDAAHTRSDWEAALAGAGFGALKLLLPFPDHRVATVLMSAEYGDGNPHAYTHLEGLKSRDGVMTSISGITEPMFWQSAAANGQLSRFANSFVILMSEDEKTLEQSWRPDFVHLPDFRRKRCFSVITWKEKNSDTVRRRALDSAGDTATGGVQRRPVEEAYIPGTPLSVVWSRSLAMDPWGGAFGRHLAAYFDYLERETLAIDLVPDKLIVIGPGEFRRFGQGWVVNYPLTPEFVLFRALVLFARRYRGTLGEFTRLHSIPGTFGELTRHHPIHTVRDFVQFGFRLLELGAWHHIAEYAALESRLRAEVSEGDPGGLVDEWLWQRIDEPERESPLRAKLYWRSVGKEYSEEHCVAASGSAAGEIATLRFDLPVDACNVTGFRFDPRDWWSGEDVGFLRVSRIEVEVSVAGKREVLLSLVGIVEIAAATTLSGTMYDQTRYGEVLAVVGRQPGLEFDVPGLDPRGRATACRVTIECSHIRSRDYRLVRDKFAGRELPLSKELEALHAQHRQLQEELQGIKQSGLWKVASLYRSFREKVT